MNLTQPLPSTLDIEQTLIATATDGGTKFATIAEIVTESDFNDTTMRLAFRWLHELFARGETPSIFTLKATYSHLPQYRAVYEMIRGVKSEHGQGIAEAAHKLKTRGEFRDLIERIEKLHTASGTAATSEDLRECVDGLIMQASCGRNGTGMRTAKQILEEVEALSKNFQPAVKMPTGFRRLDEMIKGGLQTKWLTIIAGATGGGKTVLAMNVAVSIASAGHAVGIFSLEMDAKDLMIRCVMSEGHRKIHQNLAIDRVKELPIMVADNSDVTVDSIYAVMRSAQAKHGCKVFIVDYLQLVGDKSNGRESRERVVASMSRRLKIAAKQLDVSIIALSQVNESGELRESRAIEQDADIVLHVICDKDDYFLRVTKNRHGAKHGPIKRIQEKDHELGIKLNFFGENFKFEEK